jgi:hypothetical protein
MQRRKGMVAPVYDWGPFTLAALGRWACDGNHRWPTVDIIFRDRWMAGPSCTGGRALRYRRLTIPLPWIPWYFSYQHRIFRPAHGLLSKLYWGWVKHGR